jgi:hypothetical protein
MIESGVSWEGECLGLHPGVDCHARRLAGFTAPTANAASIVAASGRFIPLAPMYSRQRVNELGSIGSRCCR